MEDTGYKMSQVHVLRHTFRPNGPFQEQLASVMRVTPNAPLQLYGTDERIVSPFEVGTKAFGIDKYEADRYMDQFENRQLQLEPGVDAQVMYSRRQGAIALQLAFTLQHTTAIDNLIAGLDVVHAGLRGYAPGFYATRLYASIPFGKLKPLEKARSAYEDIQTAFDTEKTRQLFQVTPYPHLSGVDAMRRVPIEWEDNSSELIVS